MSLGMAFGFYVVIGGSLVLAALIIAHAIDRASSNIYVAIRSLKK